MCREITTTYSRCLHTEKQFIRCQNSYAKPKKQGFFKSLFFSSTSKPKACRRKTRERSTVNGLCMHCRANIAQQQEALDKMEGQRYIAAREYNHSNPTAIQHTATRDQQLLPRQTFRCSRCIAEGRFPSPRNRESNSGLCCDYGRKEWNGPIGQAHRDLTPLNTRTRWQHDHLARPPVPPKDVPALKRVPDQRKSVRDAREAASAAARGYNWDRDARGDAPLEPGLARAFTNLSGTAGNALPSEREIAPLINWDDWNDMPQTSHGRYPPAPPAPVAPLPTRPLRPGRRETPGRISTPHMEPWMTPAPLNIRRPRTPESVDIYDVSRPTSPAPLSNSPVSPMTGTFPPDANFGGDESRYRDLDMEQLRREYAEAEIEHTIALFGRDAVRRRY